jgi:hypothetical protein
MDTPMLQKLREYLANTPREQIDKDWAAVKAKGLKGPTAKELIASFRLTPAYQETDNEAFQNESAQIHLNFELEAGDYNYALAA